MQETFIYINTSVTSMSQDSFRIWITTEVHPKFSISLLQISIHFTYEPPEGKLLCLKKLNTNNEKCLILKIIDSYQLMNTIYIVLTYKNITAPKNINVYC